MPAFHRSDHAALVQSFCIENSFNRRQEADDLTDYVNNGWLSSAEFDGPTFLWNHLIREASQEDAAQRNDVPVANLSDADVVVESFRYKSKMFLYSGR